MGENIDFLKRDAKSTQLDKLVPKELSGLPTNNLDTERNLLKFSCLSEVAKIRNIRFKAKGIRNNTTLYQSGKGNVTNLAKKNRKVLEECESNWNADQKNLLLKRIKQILSKNEKSKDYSKSYCKLQELGRSIHKIRTAKVCAACKASFTKKDCQNSVNILL